MSQPAQVPESDAGEIHFPEGLIGFPSAKHFRLLQHDGGRDLVLSCLDEPALQLPVVDPLSADSEYRPRLRPAAVAGLGTTRPENLLMLSIAVRQPDGSLLANLRAPLLIDTERCVGLQVILDDSSYSLAAPVEAAGVP